MEIKNNGFEKLTYTETDSGVKFIPTLEELKDKLVYNPKDGHLYWRRKRSEVATIGRQAGVVLSVGYRRVTLNTRHYMEHHLVWYMFKKQWPTGHVAHIDGNKTNNKIENLAMMDRTRRGDYKQFDLNMRGISVVGDKFRVRISYKGKVKHLGMFDTLLEAKEAYNDMSLRLFGDIAFIHKI